VENFTHAEQSNRLSSVIEPNWAENPELAHSLADIGSMLLILIP